MTAFRTGPLCLTSTATAVQCCVGCPACFDASACRHVPRMSRVTGGQWCLFVLAMLQEASLDHFMCELWRGMAVGARGRGGMRRHQPCWCILWILHVVWHAAGSGHWHGAWQRGAHFGGALAALQAMAFHAHDVTFTRLGTGGGCVNRYQATMWLLIRCSFMAFRHTLVPLIW